jgi:acetyl esterase
MTSHSSNYTFFINSPSNSMPLHPQAKVFLDIVNVSNRTPLQTLGALQAREAYAERPDDLAPPWVAVDSVEDRIIQQPHTSIPTRIYTPKKASTPLPICIFYHGGGMVIGSIEGYDTLCRQICVQSDCIIVSVDYRLAPEHKFPAAIDDAYAAFLWVRQHAEDFCGDNNNIAVSGDSAGGSLAAVVSITARDQNIAGIKCQVLIYPATAPHADSPSHLAFAKGYFLERDTVLWFHASYIRSDKDREDFRYAPLIAEDLSHLPPALVVVAAYDTLRDEGVAYANRLAASAVDVTLQEYAGMFHPFLSLAGVLDDGKKAITLLANYLHQHLHNN